MVPGRGLRAEHRYRVPRATQESGGARAGLAHSLLPRKPPIDAGRWFVLSFCCILPIAFCRQQGRAVMLDFRKMAVTLSVLSITAAAMTTLANAQEAGLSEGERYGLAACLVKCPDGDRACSNRCISKSQVRGVVWSDAVRACIRDCRSGYRSSRVAAPTAASEIFGCVAGCLDRMVR
jgi:hypothetical protein